MTTSIPKIPAAAQALDSALVDFGPTDAERALAVFDHALVCLYEAFARFQEQVIVTATGEATLGSLELFILIILQTRHRPKNVYEVARILNRDDIPILQYSLRKLMSAGLVCKINDKTTRVAVYDLTDGGREIFEFLIKTRDRYILQEVGDAAAMTDGLLQASKIMHMMTGHYESAARLSSTWGLLGDMSPHKSASESDST
jgi:predicted MarR family transcription regulator